MKKINILIGFFLITGLSLFAAPCGDVNSSRGIDIVDALMTARYYVGLNPQGFDQSAAEVSGDGSITIVDALQIAQYYVGLIRSFEGCAPTPAPTPPPAPTPKPTLFPGCTPTPSPPLKVFLLAGQSNMVGTGKLKDLPAEMRKAHPNVLIYNGGRAENDWINMQPGVGGYRNSFACEVSFGWEMAAAFPGETIALVKVCWGGTDLGEDWRPPGSGGKQGKLYKEFVAHVGNALKTLPGAYEPEITGMCWMQGESDALNRSFADAYEVNLTNFINDVRAEFGYPGMPFVIAMIDDSSRWKYRAAVRQAELTVADNMSNVGIFDTKGYPSDRTHYLSAGHLQLGVDFAASMLELIKVAVP